MKNKLNIIAVALALSLFITGSVNAQPAGGRGLGPAGGKGNGPCGQECLQGQGRSFALDLTDEQKAKMEDLRLEQYKAMKPLRNEMNELRAKKQTLMSADEVDVKAVHKIIDEQTALSNQMQKLQLEHRLAVRSILTEQQRMKMDQAGGFGRMGHGQGRNFQGPRGCNFQGHNFQGPQGCNFQGPGGQGRPCQMNTE
jgi:Spy/CpxP family protein refolding chaperone